MKQLLGILAVVLLATGLLAQSKAPVRLALIAENDETAAAADVLTAQLSEDPQIQLLERNEIDKVYQEQGLSAVNGDYLRLGQILGADGLLVLQYESGPTDQAPAKDAALKSWLVMSNRWSRVTLLQVTQKAEQGDATAQYYLGRAYFEGDRVAKNEQEGLKWLKRAADEGMVNAQAHLGGRYATGKGIPRDYTLAAKYYLLAAKQGHAMAQNNLGTLYQQGLGVPQDWGEAVKWYRKSAAQGEPLARKNLARLGLQEDEAGTADGTPSGPNQPGNLSLKDLNVRLIAVKTGVVLLEENISWPGKDITDWASGMMTLLNPMLPKLALLPRDAIPISVVNLRSAVQSADAQETERQLKLLTIQRLSRERQLFVLERQRMQLLGEEKKLNADESAFWNSSYLLEGVVDQNGYSPDTLTIDARLTPPKGGVPFLIEVSGSRTNYAEVINRLAAKVTGLLKVSSTVPEWDAAAEAQQYYDEAKWALKWGVYSEAQAAADSAWALGKHDEDCATVQIKAYNGLTDNIRIEEGDIDRSIIDNDTMSERDKVIVDIKKIASTHPGAVFAFDTGGLHWIVIDNYPRPRSLDNAIRALTLYYDFSRTPPSDEPKPDSAWYALGAENLTVAAQVLQHFYLVPTAQMSNSEKLAELRSLARSVADWLSYKSSANDNADGNYQGRKDEWQRRLVDRLNIFHCQATWGCFWQEKPEACIALYCNLIKNWRGSRIDNDTLYHLLKEFSSRGLQQPLVTAWDDADREHIRAVWDAFIQGPGMKFAGLEPAGANEAEIIPQYLEYWRDIQTAMPPSGKKSGQKKEEGLITAIFYFLQIDESSQEAKKIQPWLNTYRANLEALMNSTHGNAKHNVKMALQWIDQVQSTVERVSKSVPESAPARTVIQPSSGLVAAVAAADPTPVNALLVDQYFKIPEQQIPRDASLNEEGMSDLRIVGHCCCEDRLILDLRYECEMHVGNGGGWRTKALAAVFDPENNNWEFVVYPSAGTDRRYPVWPEGAISMQLFQGNLYIVQSEQVSLKGNQVGYRGRILKYDFKTRQWENLKMPELGIVTYATGLTRLSVVNGRLYLADSENIIEIIDDGKRTRVLAATRRRPAVTALDLLDNLGSPTLYSDSSNSLCAIVDNSIYSWDGKDWGKKWGLGFASWPEVWNGAILFHVSPAYRQSGPRKVWILRKDQWQPELGLYQPAGDEPTTNASAKPLWPLPEKNFLARTTMTFFGSNLYCFVNHPLITTQNGQDTVKGQGGAHARLVVLGRDGPEAVVVPLKFDLQRGPLPIESLYHNRSDRDDAMGLRDPGRAASWMLFAGNDLLIGEEQVPGVWVIPSSGIEAAVARQKAIMLKKPEPNN